MTQDDNIAAALDLLYREHEFHLDSVATTRSAIATVLGLGSTVDLGLAALSFKDGRSVDATWILLAGFAGIAAFLILGLISIDRARRAAKWPDVTQLVGRHTGSPIDLREEFLDRFATETKGFKDKVARFDLAYVAIIVLFVATTLVWIYGLAHTNPDSPPARGSSVETTTTAARR